MSELKRYIEKQIKDPAFRAEHEAFETEFQLTHALIAARMASKMTRKEFADKNGVPQSNIGCIENGTCSPTVATLQAFAEGLGKNPVISFR